MKHYFANFLHSFGLKVKTFKKPIFQCEITQAFPYKEDTSKQQLERKSTNKHRQLSIRPEKKSEKKKLKLKQVNVNFFEIKKVVCGLPPTDCSPRKAFSVAPGDAAEP